MLSRTAIQSAVAQDDNYEIDDGGASGYDDILGDNENGHEASTFVMMIMSVVVMKIRILMMSGVMIVIVMILLR